jgi:hypothetical protein
LACSDDGCVTVDRADHETPSALLWIKQLQEIRFWIECTAAQKTDREENVLLLIQITAIEMSP